MDTQSIHHQPFKDLTENVEESAPSVASRSTGPHLSQTAQIESLELTENTESYANVSHSATSRVMSGNVSDEDVGSTDDTDHGTRTSEPATIPYAARAAILGPWRLFDPLRIASLIPWRKVDIE